MKSDCSWRIGLGGICNQTEIENPRKQDSKPETPFADVRSGSI